MTSRAAFSSPRDRPRPPALRLAKPIYDATRPHTSAVHAALREFARAGKAGAMVVAMFGRFNRHAS